MTDTNEKIDRMEPLLFIAQARVAVLMQLVRILFRDRAAANGQSSDEILKWSEELKLFFENRLPPGAEAGAYMTAAVDDFSICWPPRSETIGQACRQKPARLSGLRTGASKHADIRRNTTSLDRSRHVALTTGKPITINSRAISRDRTIR